MDGAQGPDALDCTKFFICFGGSVLGEPLFCGEGMIFDGTACVTGTCDTTAADDECLANPEPTAAARYY